MLRPPFRAAPAVGVWRDSDGSSAAFAACCGTHEPAAAARPRLADLDPHLHCSVIGTCLSTAELRKLMSTFMEIDGADDLQVHHEAVRCASANAEVSRTLHKALERRHDAALQRFARCKDADSIKALWEQALRQGDVPGAYWALLTHRHASSELRQRAFGDVHMLSHLVGSANRADLCRLARLEEDNAELRVRAERQQESCSEITAQRDQALVRERQQALELSQLRAQLQSMQNDASADATAPSMSSLTEAVAWQTQRRERAEGIAQHATAELERLQLELEHVRAQARELSRELVVSEWQWQEGAVHAQGDTPLHGLHGRRILYVGGRPSSTPAIRDLVSRHGGEFQRHDGGIEDRKGLLASAVAWAHCVVFPVDCVDHDSALALKRLCGRHDRDYKVLRTASVASFVAAFATQDTLASSSLPGGFCLRRG